MGRSSREAILTGTVLQLGGVAGAIFLERLMRIFGVANVLTAAFGVSAAGLLIVGVPGLPLSGIFLLVGICSFTVVGGQQVLNGLAALWYPSHLRATGAGWAMGVGRLGSILGPVITGILLGAKVGHGALQLAAVPALASVGLRLLLGKRGTPTT